MHDNNCLTSSGREYMWYGGSVSIVCHIYLIEQLVRTAQRFSKLPHIISFMVGLKLFRTPGCSFEGLDHIRDPSRNSPLFSFSCYRGLAFLRYISHTSRALVLVHDGRRAGSGPMSFRSMSSERLWGKSVQASLRFLRTFSSTWRSRGSTRFPIQLIHRSKTCLAK